MNGEEKIHTAEIKTDSKFLRWFENFWYHHKWTTIMVSFFAVVVLICTLQMCTKEESDISFVYAGPVQMSSAEMDNVEKVMNFVMPEDFDKSGDKLSAVINYQIYSEEQIKKLEDSNSEGGVGFYVDRSYNSSNYDDFYKYIQTGESSICFLDPSLFEAIKERDRFMKLSDVLGYAPEDAADEYGVRLGDTDIYEEYGALGVLPEDTVVCILRPLVVGKSSKPELYQNEKDMLKAILEFSVEK